MTITTRSEMEQTKRDFQLTFKTPAGERVLADLGWFCRETESCVVPGDRDMTMVLEGRREAMLRIRQYLDLPVERLLVVRGAKSVNLINGDDDA